MAKTSLEKSHSKVSNFKLTLICLLLSLSVSLIFVGLAILNSYLTYSICSLAAGTLLFLLSFSLINKFVR